MNRRKLFRFVGAWVGALPLTALASGARLSHRSRALQVLDSRIAGFAYYDGKDCLASMSAGEKLSFRREPENPHDRRAVEIFWDGRKIGYVPRSHNRVLCHLMDSGEVVIGEVKLVDTGNWEPLYFTASVVV